MRGHSYHVKIYTKMISNTYLSEVIINYCFHIVLLEVKIGKKKLIILKQYQLKLKRESKVENTDKPCDVVSLKIKNKVNLKEKIKKDRKDYKFS